MALLARDVKRITHKLHSMIETMDWNTPDNLPDQSHIMHPDDERGDIAYSFFEHLKSMGW